MEKTETKPGKKSFKDRILPYIRTNLKPTAILAAVWLVLGWAYSAGFYNIFFRILDFLTGSVNGLFGSTLGGIIGRTLFAVCLHDLIRDLLVSHGSFGDRFKKFLSSFKDDVLDYIPQYGNLSYFYKEKNMGFLGCGILGAGCALMIYPFITATGALVNCSVMVLLFFAIIKDMADQGGLVKAAIRYYQAKHPDSKLDSEAVDRVLTGFAIGCAASLIPALIKKFSVSLAGVLWTILARVLPVILILAGIILIVYGKSKAGKEKA